MDNAYTTTILPPPREKIKGQGSNLCSSSNFLLMLLNIETIYKYYVTSPILGSHVNKIFRGSPTQYISSLGS